VSRGTRLGGSLLGAGLTVASPTVAAEWSFRPDAELLQTYTSNARRTETGYESDYVTEARANFPVEARGRANRFEFAYAPRYEYFWHDDTLNALTHLARLGWSREGTSVSAGTFFTYQRGDDPRLTATRAGETPAPGAPPEAPFLVQRTESAIADLNALLNFKVGRSTHLEGTAYAREQSYSDPSLVDTNEIGGAFGFIHEHSLRQQWNARLRGSRFSSDELGSQSVGIVEGGGEFELHRGLKLTTTLGGIVAASGGVLDELPLEDQILGEVRFAGNSRLVRWSAGVRRDVTAGGGLRLAVLEGEAAADLAVTLGSRDTLVIWASKSHSRQPVETGSTLDLTSDEVAARAEHRFGSAWSAWIEASLLQQESDDAGSFGTFEDDRVSIGVRWTGSAGASR
jgi:hypothetical protein